MRQQSFTVSGVTYVQEYRRCRVPCRTCETGPGHGPYWYAKQRATNGNVKSYYIGKQLPKEVESERQ